VPPDAAASSFPLWHRVGGGANENLSASEDKHMATNEGEQVLDALLLLGYRVDISDDGKITATKGTQTIRGNVETGTIVWSDRSLNYQVLRQAYIARLRLRVQASQTSTRSDTDPH
jgi:hypothetical protein